MMLVLLMMMPVNWKNLWKVEHESAQHMFSVGPMRHSFGPLLQASL
jgi:hypothetical protein